MKAHKVKTDNLEKFIALHFIRPQRCLMFIENENMLKNILKYLQCHLALSPESHVSCSLPVSINMQTLLVLKIDCIKIQ